MQRRTPGMVVEIPLSDGRKGFGQAIDHIELAVLSLVKGREELPTQDEIEAADVLFRVWVMRTALTSGRWKKIGVFPLRDELRFPVPRCNLHGGKWVTYLNGEETPASRKQCLKLEPASIWSAVHVEHRLSFYFQGRPYDVHKEIFEGPSG